MGGERREGPGSRSHRRRRRDDGYRHGRDDRQRDGRQCGHRLEDRRGRSRLCNDGLDCDGGRVHLNSRRRNAFRGGRRNCGRGATAAAAGAVRCGAPGCGSPGWSVRRPVRGACRGCPPRCWRSPEDKDAGALLRIGGRPARRGRRESHPAPRRRRTSGCRLRPAAGGVGPCRSGAGGHRGPDAERHCARTHPAGVRNRAIGRTHSTTPAWLTVGPGDWQTL